MEYAGGLRSHSSGGKSEEGRIVANKLNSEKTVVAMTPTPFAACSYDANEAPRAVDFRGSLTPVR